MQGEFEMESKNLTKMIGKKLKQIRTTRGLSLEQTSQITSVSKPMLAQIERGESNPTVNTLWKIANGLGVSFTSFIDEGKPEVQMIHFDQCETLEEESGLFVALPIFPIERNKQYEIFHIIIKPNCKYVSHPHPDGVEEYIIMETGTLHLTINRESYVLTEKNAIKFSANYEHIYENRSTEEVHVTMIIYYP